MANQLTSNAEALRLFFTDDIYLIPESKRSAVIEPLIIEKPTKAKVAFKYLGKNQKNILILVNDGQNDVSTVQGRELLRKLVKAIDLTANDFALVNYANYEGQNYIDFKEVLNCKLILAFGVSPANLAIPEQTLHQLIKHDDVKFIFTSNLAELDRDQASKKALWTSLQRLK